MKKMCMIIAALTVTSTIMPAQEGEAAQSTKTIWHHLQSPKTGIAAAFAAYPTIKTAIDTIQQKRQQRAFTQTIMQQLQYFDLQKPMHARNLERIELFKNDKLSAPCRKVILYYEQQFIDAYRLYTAEREQLMAAIKDNDIEQAKMLFDTTLIRFVLLMSVSSDMDFNFQRALEKSEPSSGVAAA